MPPRDLTLRQFYAALARHGMRMLSAWNSLVFLDATKCLSRGDDRANWAALRDAPHQTRRGWLAYLLQKQARANAEREGNK